MKRVKAHTLQETLVSMIILATLLVISFGYWSKLHYSFHQQDVYFEASVRANTVFDTLNVIPREKTTLDLSNYQIELEASAYIDNLWKVQLTGLDHNHDTLFTRNRLISETNWIEE